MAFNPAEPNSALYGLIPQAYAQSLASPTGDPTADAVNRLNLGFQARNSTGLRGYEDLIRDANARGFEAEMGGQQTQRDVAYIQNAANLVGKGVGGAIHPGASTQLGIDPRAVRLADAEQMRALAVEDQLKLAQAQQAAAAADQQIDPALVQGLSTPAYANLIAPAAKPFVTTENKAKMMNAEANKEEAKFAGVRAKNGSGNSRDYTEISEEIDPLTGKKVQTTRRRIYGGGGGGGGDNDAPAVVKKEPRTILVDGKVKPNPKYKGE